LGPFGQYRRGADGDPASDRSGYRDIVCIASETSAQRQFKERYEGYAELLREQGMVPRLITFEEGMSRDEQGRRAAVELIRSGVLLMLSLLAATKWRWARFGSCANRGFRCLNRSA
jgi:hypothetical protein